MLRGDIVKRRLWSLRSFYWTGLVCVPNDCRKSNGCYCKVTRLWRTSSWCSICLYTQVKIGGRSQIAQNSQVRMSRRMDTSSTTQNGLNPGQTLKILWYFSNEICMDIHWQDCYGKDNSRKFYWNLDGKKYQIGNVCLFIENKDYSYRFSWMTYTWLERSRMWLPCGRELMKNVDLDEPTSFLDHVYLGCTQRECKPNEMFCENKDVWITYFCWSNWKITRLGKASRKDRRVVLRHGRTCSKMRWAILRAGKQKSGATYKVSSPCLDDHQFEQEELESVGELSQVCSQIVFIKMLVPGTNWETRHSVVCQQTCKSSHKMDSGMRQTICKIDFIHSSHKWIPTILSCG